VNNDLYNKRFKVPDEIREHMRNSFNSISSESGDEGHKRNKELQEKKHISYQQLKRIKNFFDSFNGDTQEKSYILNGGDYMKKWVNETLRYLRDDNYNSKKIASDTGMSNEFNDGKQDDISAISAMNRPSKSHQKTNNDIKITETLKRINELMKKII